MTEFRISIAEVRRPNASHGDSTTRYTRPTSEARSFATCARIALKFTVAADHASLYARTDFQTLNVYRFVVLAL